MRVVVDPEVELALLATIITDEGIRADVGAVDPGLFASAEGRAIAEVVATFEGKPIDGISVFSAVRARGWMPEPVPDELAVTLYGRSTSSTKVAAGWVDRIRELAAARELRRVLAEALNDEDRDVSVVRADLLRKVEGIDVRRSSPIRSIAEDMEEFVGELEAEFSAKPGSEIRSAGFVGVDAVTGGLESGLPHLIAARPGVGKSAHAVGTVRSICGAGGEPTAVFWLEDTRRKFLLRLAAAEGGIPAMALRHGRLLQPAMWERLAYAQDRIAKWPLYIEADRLSPRDLASRMRRLTKQKGVRRFIFDHLGEIAIDEKGGNERTDMLLGDTFRAYRDATIDLDAGGIMYHQLNKRAEQGGRPELGWLFNSDVLAQVARVVAFLFRSGDERKVTMHFVKATYGPPGVAVELGWDPVTMSIFQPEPARETPEQRSLV